MSDLAILGGNTLRTRPFPQWPQHAPGDLARLETVLESRNWGGYPFPNKLANDNEIAARLWQVSADLVGMSRVAPTTMPVKTPSESSRFWLSMNSQ